MNERNQFTLNSESSHPSNINYFAAQIVYLSTLKDSIVDSAPLLAPTNINYTEHFDLLPQTRQ